MHVTRRLVWLASTLLWAGAALGQGMIVPDRWWDRDRWIPVPPGAVPLPTVSQKVTADVRGFAAVTTVEQSFSNPYGSRIEGTFLFPLPEGAGVTNFAMTIGGEEVAAELLDARRAREVYENIVRSMRDPGLLEYIGRDVFRARIFPIEAGEVKKVKLEFTQAVPVDAGLARFVFPLRARAGTQRPWQPRPMPLVDGPAGPPIREDSPPPTVVGSLGVDVTIRAEQDIKTVYSPSHEIDVHRDGERTVRVGFEASQMVPTEDFTLYWQLSDAMFGLNLIAQRGAADDEGTFMMLLAPKSELRTEEIQAKDIVFVFDVSGSMAGAKIDQAKGALRFCLNNLNAGDRFNVVAFSTEVDAFERALVALTPDALKSALEFVDGLRARGGTNINEALRSGLAMLPPDNERPAMVLFMTDGLPTVGETKPGRILEDAGAANTADARLFAFGVGDDVNTMLLDRLTDDNRGTRTYVRPTEDIEQSVSSLYAKIASPVLGDLRLEVQGVELSRMQPVRLPDLFTGSQITLLGRYKGHGPAKVVLHGKSAGQEQAFEYSVDFPERERQHPFIPRLWATRQVGYLLDQIRLNGEDKELVAEVVDLATKYGILTPYTSYLVLEPGMTVESEVAAAVRDRRGFAGAPMPTGGAPAGPPGPSGPAQPGLAERPTDAVSGAGAVARSSNERGMRDADRAADASVATRQAAGRAFYQLDDGQWVDSAVPADQTKLTLIKVRYGSDAYFELLGLREEMREILAVGPSLKVKINEAVLIIREDEGDEALTDAARAALRE